MMLFQTVLATSAQDFVSFSQDGLLSLVFKVLFLLSVLFYCIFAVIVIRQVQIMKNTLITPISPLILLFSILHLVLAVGVFLLFLVIL